MYELSSHAFRCKLLHALHTGICCGIQSENCANVKLYMCELLLIPVQYLPPMLYMPHKTI
jgi:hypothetical protein